MPDANPKSVGTPGEELKVLKYCGIALGALLAAGPLVAALPFFFGLRPLMKRRDWVILACGGLVGIVVAGGLSPYGSWLSGLVTGHNRWGVPWFLLLSMGAVVSGAVGLLDGTAVGAKIPSLWQKGSIGDRPDLVPTEAERQRIDIVAPPVLTADPMAHSMNSNIPVGERPFPIGVDRSGRPYYLTEKEIETHALVFGATGSGKSKTIETLAAGMLDLGWAGMILDLKEDTKPGGLRDWCAAYAASHSIPFQELRLSDPNPKFWFDPLAGLDQDEARDAILSLTKFDDEYYKNVCKAVLGQLLKLMFTAHQIDPATFSAPTIAETARILASPSLPAATKKLRAIVAHAMPHMDVEAEFHTLARPQKVEADQAASWGYKLGNVIATQAGALVLSPPSPETAANKHLLDVTSGGLIYVGLDSQGKQDLTKMVSSAVLQRLAADAAQRTTGNIGPRINGAKPYMGRKFVIVDEANWVDRTITQNLLSRARSAGTSLILCTQGPMDWIDKDGDDFAKLAQNTNVAILMRQGEPRAAELCADYIGKSKFFQVTYSQQDDDMMNRGSVREEEDHLVTPDQLRNLRIGEAIVRVGVPSTRYDWVKVSMRDPNVTISAETASPSMPAPSRFRAPFQ